MGSIANTPSGVSRDWFWRPEVEAQGWSLGRGCRQSSNFPPRLVDCENATKDPMKCLQMIRNHAWNSSISPPPICWRKPCPAIRGAKRSVLAYLGSRKRDCRCRAKIDCTDRDYLAIAQTGDVNDTVEGCRCGLWGGGLC